MAKCNQLTLLRFKGLNTKMTFVALQFSCDGTATQHTITHSKFAELNQ